MQRDRLDIGRDAPESLFVSKIGGDIVGMARLVEDRPEAARILVFHVDSQWCHTAVPGRLLSSIHDYCWSHGRLSLVLEPSAAPLWVLHMLSRCGFRFLRAGKSSGRGVLEFQVVHHRMRLPRAPAVAVRGSESRFRSRTPSGQLSG
jgi:hypothetical protein